MTQYRLKKNQPAFEVVDGPMAGKQYTHGVTYTEIPAGEAKKFIEIKPVVGKGKTAKATGGDKK